MILYPNAKINIGLDVLRKREDGYHEISSIFFPLKKVYDVLEVINSDDFSFTTTGIKIPGTKNICELAYNLLNDDFDIPPVAIHLHKQIPVGSGLGGGSSNGAFTLLALNQLFNINLDLNQLQSYALKLGADCSFFIQNKPQYVKGIGQILSPIDLNLFDYEIRVINPNIHISTAEAYDEVVPRIPRINLLDRIKSPIEDWRLNVKNDFEDSVFKKYPQLKKIKSSFYAEGAIYVSMTGSGSVIYGLFNKED